MAVNPRLVLTRLRLLAGEHKLFTGALVAGAVLRLYRDEALWRKLAAGGLSNVARHFAADAARDTVRRVLLPDKPPR